jgi:hypothetical protein
MTFEEIPELLRFTAIYRCFQIRAIAVATGRVACKNFPTQRSTEA